MKTYDVDCFLVSVGCTRNPLFYLSHGWVGNASLCLGLLVWHTHHLIAKHVGTNVLKLFKAAINK